MAEKIRNIGCFPEFWAIFFGALVLFSEESGFTALPGGGIDGARKFSQIEEDAYFWSASEYEGVYGYEQNVAYSLELEHARYTAYLGMETKTNVASVRCIQNTR